MKSQISYKFRIYPSQKQGEALNIAFGHARFVWNWALNLKTNLYDKYNISLSTEDLSAELTLLKQQPEYQWLGDAPATCLIQKLIDLKRAYVNFFEGRAKFPNFKSKFYDQSIRFQDIVFKGRKIKVPKIGTFILNGHERIKGHPKMATISRNTLGEFYLSFSCAVAHEMPTIPPSGMVGIDLGISKLATLSNGKVFNNPRFLKNKLKALKRSQRALKRAQHASKRKEKLRLKVARCHKKVANARKDLLHKISNKIIKHNQIIVMEDLKVSQMIGDRRYSASIADVGWGMFKTMLEYKSNWRGRTFIKVDPAYTSKTCSNCETINYWVKSHVQWTCVACGHAHNRDENASINILIKGLRMIVGSILPEGVLNDLKLGNVRLVDWTKLVPDETRMSIFRCDHGTTPCVAH